MARVWTEAQKKAIEACGKNILVSAAAGSGKTAVLVERVIQKITDSKTPLQIDRLLIATFTNAAANNMQIKIREALKKRLDSNPDNEYLAKQLALLPKAAISTVHSFCQDLVRNNFHRLGLCADFEIGEQTQLSILQKQALEIVINDRYENSTPAFEVLMAGFGERKSETPLSNLVLSIYNFTKSTADPQRWLADAAESYISQDGFLKWSGFIISSLKDEISGMVSAYDEAIEVIQGGNGIDSYLENFIFEQSQLKRLYEMESGIWDEMRAFIHGIAFERLPRKDRDADEWAVSFVQNIRNTVKKQVAKLKSIFYATSHQLKQDNAALYPIIKELCQIVSDFDEVYSALKRSKNLLDFNDLEHFALKLLSFEDIKNELKERFEEVLVDEYQDTNGVQEALFQSISRGDNLFMVGDVKQSIYGFRNAQPNIFTSKSAKYASDSSHGMQINLSHNFRCAQSIIDFVNLVFGRLMSKSVGSVDYNEGHSLVCGRKHSIHPKGVEFHVIEKKLEENDENEFTEEELLYTEIMREAMFVAKRIVSLVEVEKPHIVVNEETGQTRPIQYSDIAILARKNKGVSDIFAQQLALYQVPFYCEDEGGNFLVTIEIATVLSFLQIIDNPMQDIPLLAVMRSPMFMFTDEEFAHIRQNSQESFYDAVCKTDTEKCQKFLEKLNHYRQIAAMESIEFLIRAILSDTGYISFVAAMPDGKTRVANLNLLCERAGRFEADGYKSIFEFLNYIDAMRENPSYTVAKVVGENDNVVRMMSIHKSKGLEFPVVFLVRCGERFNKSDQSGNILHDLDLGIGANFTDLDRNIRYPSVSKLAISQKKLYSMLSEEMRVLYVALTRPKDMLFIVGSCANLQKKMEQWENTSVSPYIVAQQNTFLDWLALALGDRLHTHIHLHTAEDIILQSRVGIDSQVSFFEDETPSHYSKQTDEVLSYTYPYRHAAFIPSKLPVSKAAQGAEYLPTLKKPDFIEKTNRLSAALRGTIIHFVMQNIDLAKTNSLGEIEGQIKDMVDRGMLDESFVFALDTGAILAFFQSDIGMRMKNADKIEREVKFFTDVSALEIFPGIDESVKDETVLLQGVIDCYFEEDGEIVIIDYKTGNIDRPEYEKQVEFYAKGLSKVLKKPVKETVVYPLI